jgi:hypothetical protein
LNCLIFRKLIEQYANNNEGAEAYLFEDALTDGFNMFYNVEAEKVGGAGNTDLECLYIPKKKKFAVDAKSTKNKLSGVNAGRLEGHREKLGSLHNCSYAKICSCCTSRYSHKSDCNYSGKHFFGIFIQLY